MISHPVLGASKEPSPSLEHQIENIVKKYPVAVFDALSRRVHDAHSVLVIEGPEGAFSRMARGE